MSLGGSFSLAALGTFNYTAGTVNLTGTLNNAGNTLTLNAASGSWNLVGGTVNGGTVSESGGAELVPTNSGGTLSGVTMNGPLDLGGSGANTAPQVNVTNGLTLNNSTIYVGNAAGSTYGRVYFQGNETLGGTGTVLLGKNGNNELYLNSSGNTLTIGAGITIHGSYGVLTTGSSSAIVNQGTISADDSGGVAGNFIYDTGYSGGETQSTAYAVNTSGVSNPAPQAVYQTERYYGTFSYTLANLTPAAAYTLQLDFADLLSSAAGQNKFNVTINGTQVLTSFDIYAAAGGSYKAVAESFPVTASGSGTIAVTFTPTAGNVAGQRPGGLFRGHGGAADQLRGTGRGHDHRQSRGDLHQPGNALRQQRRDAHVGRSLEQRGDDHRHGRHAQPGQRQQCLGQHGKHHRRQLHGEPGRFL